MKSDMQGYTCTFCVCVCMCVHTHAHVLHTECLEVCKGEDIWEVGEMKGWHGTLLEDWGGMESRWQCGKTRSTFLPTTRAPARHWWGTLTPKKMGGTPKRMAGGRAEAPAVGAPSLNHWTKREPQFPGNIHWSEVSQRSSCQHQDPALPNSLQIAVLEASGQTATKTGTQSHSTTTTTKETAKE